MGVLLKVGYKMSRNSCRCGLINFKTGREKNTEDLVEGYRAKRLSILKFTSMIIKLKFSVNYGETSTDKNTERLMEKTGE